MHREGIYMCVCVCIDLEEQTDVLTMLHEVGSVLYVQQGILEYVRARARARSLSLSLSLARSLSVCERECVVCVYATQHDACISPSLSLSLLRLRV